jgi:8-oxo-dGTP pyrophosphatase MutT (NUDIX family)
VSVLDLDPNRKEAPPKDAATLIVLRESSGAEPALEVFCVQRHPKSGFLGGAIVFPGGKVDPADSSDAWNRAAQGDVAEDRASRIAACREALEEAAILPLANGALSHAELLALRKESALAEQLAARGLALDLNALVPFARWVTPIAEARRYDTRFYLTALPAGQVGAHDDNETTSSFWATPAEVLGRFARGEVQLAPPTHRSLEVLVAARTLDEARAIARASSLDPICPRLVSTDGAVALVLPGDPDHDVRESRSPGKSRYVLRDGRFLPEDAPPR